MGDIFSSIPTWVYTVITVSLILATIIVAYNTQGGVKKPYQLLALTLVTIIYVFSLTFIHGVGPTLGLDLRGGVSVVLEAKGDNITPESMELAADIIRARVDSLGVAEPEITPQGHNIIVDIPGIKDTKHVQEVIGQTAELRFRQVAENNDTDQNLVQILNQIMINQQAKISSTQTGNTKKVDKNSSTKSGSTTSSTNLTSSTNSSSVTSSTVVTGKPGKSFRRVTTDTSTQKTQSITPISAPEENTITPISAPESTNIPATIPQITSVQLQCGGTAPTTVTLTGDLTKATPRENDIADKPIIALDAQGKAYALCPTVLKGDIVKSAQRSVDSSGEVSVGVELTDKGAQQFTDKIGRPLSNQRVAIVLDTEVVSAPTIQPSLANGMTNNSLQITVGNDKNAQKEIDRIVTVLKFGKLPLVLELQTVQKVSATLGTDQLRAGIIAGGIGLLLVIIYMILYYRILALVVVGGLMLSGMSVYALVTWLGVSKGMSLTLAGAVGLIVSLGVTVDSYVVYFEKLKDEVKQGRTLRSCLDTAFKSSFRTILAADLVSLIGAVVLFYLAAGSVRGFAFFLGISTFLDLLISVTFMHPMVKVLAQNQRLVSNSIFGFAGALNKKDLDS